MVDEIIHFLGAKGQRSHATSRLIFLQRVVDNTCHHQTENPISHRFSVEPQVTMVHKPVQSGIRDASDSDLQGRPVWNLSSDVLADRGLDLRRRTKPHVHRRVVALDGGSNGTLMDHG